MIRAIVPAPTLMLPTRARRRHVGACRHPGMVASAAPRGLGRKGRHGSCPGQCLMLRITTTIGAEGDRGRAQGTLAGPWVDELAQAWKSLTAARDAGPVSVVLDAVTFVDPAGRPCSARCTRRGRRSSPRAA